MDIATISTIIGTGVAVSAFIYGFLRNFKADLRNEMREMKTDLRSEMKEMKIEIKETNRKIDKLDEKVTDIDRRLCRLEGAFSSKDCCMIKDDRHLKKAE